MIACKFYKPWRRGKTFKIAFKSFVSYYHIHILHFAYRHILNLHFQSLAVVCPHGPGPWAASRFKSEGTNIASEASEHIFLTFTQYPHFFDGGFPHWHVLSPHWS